MNLDLFLVRWIRFLDNYELVVIELAKIAEEEGADIFAPMKETDFIIGFNN